MADRTNENESDLVDNSKSDDELQRLRDQQFDAEIDSGDGTAEVTSEDDSESRFADGIAGSEQEDVAGESLPEEQDDSATFRAQHTSLQCLALIARHHGLDVSADRLIHDYGLEEEEPNLRRVLRIAKDAGFKAKHTRLTWKHLRRMDQAFPAMARLENGNYVIMIGLRKVEKEDGSVVEEIALFDPLADRKDFIFLDQEGFEKSWKGETLLTKRNYSMLDSNQPFSLRWFLPEIFRQRKAFVDVAVAVLFLNLIALVVPLFFQIVIDKVLVNYAISTLQVITVGICVALVFDAILSFLRGYLLLNATSKIDIRVATRTFQHMLQLPMNFFEKITAGVLIKHMQQTAQIREFLDRQSVLDVA